MQAVVFENVSFAYTDGKPILNNASFNIDKGEFVALVGENGSGKSTIAKMTDAFVLPSSGHVSVFGKDISEVAREGSNELLEFRCDLGFVQQNPDNQFVATRVIDEVAFGPSGLGIGKDEVAARVFDSLEQIGSTDLAGRDVNTLSGGQKQRIAIADALAMRPKMFIFDEPTSMLDETGKTEIMQIIRGLHENGATILLITHSIDEAKSADRVLKIENGKVSETPDLDTEEILAFQKVAEFAEKLNPVLKHAEQSDNNKAPVIQFQNIAFEYNTGNDLMNGIMGAPIQNIPVFKSLNLNVNENELLCVAGPNGCGKSTLASLMNGLLKPTEGEVIVYGASTSTKQGANAARRHVGVCFQYPERNFFCQNVVEEVAFGPRSSGYSKKEAEMMALEAISAVGLKADEIAQVSPFDLSGGMQRKVALASILSMKPDVLVLDEPCAGLDLSSHAEFLLLMLELKKNGQTIVLITHDKKDIELLADRVFYLS